MSSVYKSKSLTILTDSHSLADRVTSR